MKRMFIMLLLAGSLCQPAYGFSLDGFNSLFSNIKESTTFSTINENKTVISLILATTIIALYLETLNIETVKVRLT